MSPTSPALTLRLAASAALILISACSPKGATNAPQAAGSPSASASPAPASPGAAPTAAAGPLSFANLPRPKAGLWRIVVDDGDGHPMTMTECYSGAAPATATPKNCSKMNFNRDLTGTVVGDFECGDDRMKIVEHFEGRGDYQTQMVSDGQMTITVQGQPPKVSKMHSVSTRLGDCPAGAKLDSPDVSG